MEKFIVFLLIIGYKQTLQLCQHDSNKRCNTELHPDDGRDFILIDNQTNGYYTKLEEFEGSGSGDDADDGNNNLIGIVKAAPCTEPGYQTICSGKGVCSNHSCICDTYTEIAENSTISYRYYGRYCEECSYCRGVRCRNYLNCVNCLIVQGKGQQENCLKDCPYSFSRVTKLQKTPDKDEKICEIEHQQGCFVRFLYYYDDNNRPFLIVEDSLSCVDGTKILFFTFWGVLIYIFILVILVPKICPVASDNRKILKSNRRITSEIIRNNHRNYD